MISFEAVTVTATAITAFTPKVWLRRVYPVPDKWGAGWRLEVQ